MIASIGDNEELLTVLCRECSEDTKTINKINIIKNYINQLSELKNNELNLNEKKKCNNIISALHAFSDFIISKEESNSLLDIDEAIKKCDNANICKSPHAETYDGMQIFFDKFNTVDDFVKFVISGCVFFQKSDVINRFDEMSYRIEHNEPLSARLSTKRDYYGKKLKRATQIVIFKDENKEEINTIIDGNGNANIDKLIRDITGYCLKSSKSRKADMVNLKISHIWGKAYHPSFFSSLWNIVLVPIFANDLLDKPSASNGDYFYGAVLLNTIKALIFQLYNLNSLDWDKLKINRPSYDEEKVVHGTYSFKVFNNKDEKALNYSEITI